MPAILSPPRQARSLLKSRPHKRRVLPAELKSPRGQASHNLSGVEVRAALGRAGFVFRRQTGSHMILRRDQPYARAVVPDHKQVRSGTLRRIIADAGLTVDQFVQLLGR